MSSYVIAIKREQRAQAPSNWLEHLAGIEGLEIQGSHNPYRVQVTASEKAIRTAQQQMGDLLHIEPLILHEPQPVR